MPADESTVPPKPKMRWLLLLWGAVLFVWGMSGFLLAGDQNRGTFGDMFGAANALFTGLAFATLIYTAWMQREELALPLLPNGRFWPEAA